MGRKVGGAVALILFAVVSAGLVGGQVGQFLWWGTHEPIYIYGDEGFTYANGVMSGSGTEKDPFILEGWNLAPANADYGIYVDHTTSHFVIRDCVIEGARVAGVYFNTVENGRIERTQILRSDVAVFLLNSRENRVLSSVVAECRYGVVMGAQSRDNVVVGNSFLDNGLAAHDPAGWNFWYEGKDGNYWSDYEGVDQNKDGVGDEPYYPVGDLRPLMAAPVELTAVAPAGPTFAGNLVAPDGSLVVTSQTPIALTAADPGSGLAEIKYSLDGGPWSTYSGPIFLKGDDGPRKLSYYGVDRLGNAEPKKSVSFLLDDHSPQTAMDVGDPKWSDARGTWVSSKTEIALRRTQESTYGRSVTYYRINDGAWLIYSKPFRLTGEDGARAVSFYSRNASGVTEAVQTKTLIKDDAPPTSHGAKAQPSTSASVSASPATTPTVSPSGTSAPVTTKPVTTPATTPSATPAAPTPAAPPAAATTPAPATTPATKPAATPPSAPSTPAASPATPSAPGPTSASATPPDATAQAELAGAALGQPGTSAPAPIATQTGSQVVPSATQTQSSTTTPAPNSSPK